MEKMIGWVREKLGVVLLMQLLMEREKEIRLCEEQLTELKQRIIDLEDAYPGYKQAKEEADAKPEPIVQGFVPYTRRKRQWELEHRRAEKK